MSAATVVGALTHWSSTRPDHPAIDFDDDILTYRELDNWSHGVGRQAVDAGVRPGDRVAILGANSLEWVAAAMGAHRGGAIVVPFNHRMTSPELAVLAEECDPTLVYCSEELRPKLDEAVSARPDLVVRVLERDVRPLRAGTHAPLPQLSPGPDDPTVIVFTSGTTGRPKGVIFTHGTLAATMFEWSMIHRYSHNDLRPLLVLPLFTAAGIIWTLERVVLTGGTLVMEPGFDPARALRLLSEKKVNTLATPPIIWEQLAAAPGFEDADLTHLVNAHVGGARVVESAIRKWQDKGVVVCQMYGQTEVGGYATAMPPELAAEHPEKCGRGGVFTRMRVVDTDGADCPPHEAGEILLQGPGVMPGYWGNDEATKAAFDDDGWLRTGDRGKFDEDGNLTFVDRMKDLIISGGLNISSAEIEHVVNRMDGIDEVAVISVPDTKFGETPAAIVTTSVGVTVDEIITHCNARLADYKVPRYVVILETPLPRNAMGKINKLSLRERYESLPATHAKVR